MSTIATKVSEAKDCQYNIEVTVPGNIVQQEFKAVCNRLRGQVKIPGFRPGKVTDKILLNKYKVDIQNEVSKGLIQRSFSSAIQENELKPIGQPFFQDNNEPPVFEMGKEAVFTVVTDVEPSVEVPDYSAFELKRPVKEIADQDLEETLGEIRRQRAQYQKVEEGTIEADDLLQCAYEAQTDLEADDIPETANTLLKNESSWINVSNQQILPVTPDMFEGKKLGDKFDLELTFADDFREEYLQGKALTYAFEIKEINRLDVPELSEEFAKDLGIESLDKLKELCRENMEREYTDLARNVMMNQVQKQLDSAVAEFPLPPALLANEKHLNLVQLIMDKQNENKDAEEQLNADELYEDNDLNKKAEENAVRYLRMRFIIDSILNKEEIQPDFQQVRTRYEQFRKQSGLSEEEFSKQYNQDRLIESIVYEVKTNQAFDKVIEGAKITDVDPDSLDEEGEEKEA